MFRYCPACGSPEIRFEGGKVFHCPCCFVYYHNTAAAVGCVIDTGDAILFLIRGREPGRGKLDLPGGFVDPGEGALEGLRRELREEIGWEPPRPDHEAFTLFASFPNIYPYKNIPYNTCDLFFALSAPGLGGNDLRLAEDEIAGIRFVRPEALNLDDLAFDSTRRAVRAYRALRSPQANG
ncbi:MAG: NUDIX domain-containing protein [Treponema sp.]|jgi:ADP-ribose pyrophosphatase YjhB (NUDIX family)|nr:NUDIX domain-containing protein [Treponema sp.]